MRKECRFRNKILQLNITNKHLKTGNESWRIIKWRLNTAQVTVSVIVACINHKGTILKIVDCITMVNGKHEETMSTPRLVCHYTSFLLY